MSWSMYRVPLTSQVQFTLRLLEWRERERENIAQVSTFPFPNEDLLECYAWVRKASLPKILSSVRLLRAQKPCPLYQVTLNAVPDLKNNNSDVCVLTHKHTHAINCSWGQAATSTLVPRSFHCLPMLLG